MNIYWYEQIQALEALIHSYEMLRTFHEGNYELTDEDQKDVRDWRSLIWDRIDEITKAMEKDTI